MLEIAALQSCCALIIVSVASINQSAQVKAAVLHTLAGLMNHSRVVLKDFVVRGLRTISVLTTPLIATVVKLARVKCLVSLVRRKKSSLFMPLLLLLPHLKMYSLLPSPPL